VEGVSQNSSVALFILILTIGTSVIAWQYEGLFRLFALNPWTLLREGRYYTFLTSGLIHADLAHLFVNMFTFYSFAFALERLLGHWQFLALYAASLILSNLTTTVKHRDDPSYFCVGASGAVTAVIFSFIIYEPRATIGLFGILPIPALLFAVLFVGWSYYAARYRETRVNHAAHLWGALSGLALTLLLDPGAYRIFLRALRLSS
jgi:membrane associated rhomboid family serine protease